MMHEHGCNVFKWWFLTVRYSETRTHSLHCSNSRFTKNFFSLYKKLISSRFHNGHCYRSLKTMSRNFPDFNRRYYFDKCIKWHRTWYPTARHVKSHGYVIIPGNWPQTNVSGHNVTRQQVCLLCVNVIVGLEGCWNCLPRCSVLPVTDVVWLHILVIMGIRTSLCSHAYYSMRSL